MQSAAATGRVSTPSEDNAAHAGSRSRDAVSEERLREITCGELTDKLKGLFSYAYEVFLYGSNMEGLTETCLPFVKQITGAVPDRKMYPQPETGPNRS